MKESIKSAFVVLLVNIILLIVFSRWIMKQSPIVAIVLSLLKLTDTLQMTWFGEITELSALGTPLWMIVFWVILDLLLMLILTIADVVD